MRLLLRNNAHIMCTMLNIMLIGINIMFVPFLHTYHQNYSPVRRAAEENELVHLHNERTHDTAKTKMIYKTDTNMETQQKTDEKEHNETVIISDASTACNCSVSDPKEDATRKLKAFVAALNKSYDNALLDRLAVAVYVIKDDLITDVLKLSQQNRNERYIHRQSSVFSRLVDQKVKLAKLNTNRTKPKPTINPFDAGIPMPREMQKMKEKLEGERVGTDDCTRWHFSTVPLWHTALASHPGSGNTWVRYLIQKLTGGCTISYRNLQVGALFHTRTYWCVIC